MVYLIGARAPRRLRGYEPHVVLPDVAMAGEELGKVSKYFARRVTEVGGDFGRGGDGVHGAELPVMVAVVPFGFPFGLDPALGPVSEVRKRCPHDGGERCCLFGEEVGPFVPKNSCVTR